MHPSLGKTITAGAALAAMLCAIPALAGDQDFTLHNTSSKTMVALYVSPHSEDKWGPNILDNSAAAGSDVKVTFSHDADACHWDVKGEFEGGATAEVDDVDLCTVEEVTFHD